MTRNELILRIKRNLGCPMINVEIHDSQINDAINKARDKWIMWAVGNATQEKYITVLLKGGQRVYDLPAGVVDVISYQDRASGFGTFDAGGINTLFSFENYMYNNGMMGAGHGAFNFIDYHIALDFIDTSNRYICNKYNYSYHKMTNQLVLDPPPAYGKITTLTEAVSADDNAAVIPNPLDVESVTTVIDSPGFALIKAYVIEGSTLPTYTSAISGANDIDYPSQYDIGETYSEALWSEGWIDEYVTALCKITLGLIRRKLGNMTALGNAGLPLDGPELLQEGKEDKDKLEEDLPLKYSFEGYGVITG
jgi:hypothetical protein